MNKKKTIVIAGGGFAGLTACDYLRKKRNSFFGEYEVILIDRKKTFDFLPLTPDVLGGWLNPGSVTIDLARFARRRGVQFINEAVEGLDPDKNILRLSGLQLAYDFAIVSVGSDANFFGKRELEAGCLKLKSVQDAVDIKSQIIANTGRQNHLNIVIVGAGYTGLEVAMNTHYLVNRNRLNCHILVVETRDSILSGLPERLKKIAKDELINREIEIVVNDTVSKYENNKVVFGSGREINGSICIWSAGVQAPSFLLNLNAEKERGRIIVNEKLNIYGKEFKNLFLAGDCCSFTDSKTGRPLRMAVVFSLGQGKIAAQNVINSIEGKQLVNYRPVDPGYLIPLTYYKAPGIVFGHNVGGHIGYILHYCLSIYYSRMSNKLKILRDLFFRRFLKLDEKKS